jgi:large subunit ribosomal protein L7/L12
MMAARRGSVRRGGRGGGGGAGGLLAGIVVVALLGGLAWFGWTRINAPAQGPAAEDVLRAAVLRWQSSHQLTRGTVPEPVPDTYRFSFEGGARVRKLGAETDQPSYWVEIQLEGGRFTGVQIAVYRDALQTGPYGIVEEPEFAGPDQGRELRDLIRSLGKKPDGSSLEEETAGFRLFGWRKKSPESLRRSLICVVRKENAPLAAGMLGTARAEWGAGVAGGPTEPAGPRTKFDVVLRDAGKDRDAVLAAVCELLGVGPDLGAIFVDEAPKVLKRGVSESEAAAIRGKLEAAGAKVEVK